MYYIGNITEESEDALEEEVATVNEKYVVVQVFSHGGFLPTRFSKQQIFTLDKFIRRILLYFNNALTIWIKKYIVSYKINPWKIKGKMHDSK